MLDTQPSPPLSTPNFGEKAWFVITLIPLMLACAFHPKAQQWALSGGLLDGTAIVFTVCVTLGMLVSKVVNQLRPMLPSTALRLCMFASWLVYIADVYRLMPS